MKYTEYLQSSYWKQVARAVKARAGNRCQVCNSRKELCAHHRTYENKGNEMNHLDDLTCLCLRCHTLFHDNSRLARGTKTPLPPKPRRKRREKKPFIPLGHVTRQAAYLSDHLDMP